MGAGNGPESTMAKNCRHSCRRARLLAASLLLACSLCFGQDNDKQTELPALPYTRIGSIQIPNSEYAQSQIQKYVNEFTRPFGKRQLYEILDRGSAYRLYVRQELKKRNMPQALEYLPVVESEYKPTAVSRSGAKGLWQFMDNSIAGLLKKTEYVDERYDPWKSTDAALTKLQENYSIFKDWPIAIAAYNCGNGAMKKILAQTKTKTFWHIAQTGLLRDQSVQYVPKLLAICYLSTDGEEYGIELPDITESKRYAEFDYIATKQEISLDRLSSELKMEPEVLRTLNPSLIKGCTPPSAIYNLRVPTGMKESARIAIDAITNASRPYSEQGIMHTVQKGETLWSISRRYGATVQSLRELNGLEENDTLAEGKILYIRQPKADN